MTYCQKCGTKNEDDAEFCKKCGASLKGDIKTTEKEFDKKCEEECQRGPSGRGWGIFWAVIIVLVGIWVIIEFGIKNIATESLPSYLRWLQTFPIGIIFAVIVGIFIIIFGLRLIGKK